MANVPTQFLKVAGKFGSYGEDGKPGVTFTPNVSDEGELTWTNNGGLANPAPVNVKGQTGVHVGTSAPTDPNVTVWIDPSDDNVAFIGNGSVYYKSLSTAISDINAGNDGNATDIESATVRVFTGPTGVPTVMLLTDVTEDANITIDKDIILVIGEHTVTLSTAAARLSFGAGTNCQVIAKGNGGVTKTISDATTSSVGMIATSGDTLTLEGGAYTISANDSAGAMAFSTAAACKLFKMDSCVVDATNINSNANAVARCIQNQGAKVEVNNSTFTSTAQGVTQAIMGLGEIVINGSTITAYSETNTVKGVWALGTAVEINNSAVSATTNSDNYSACAIENPAGCTLTVRNSKAFGDAKGVNATSGSLALGIGTNGIAYLENVEVHGTHSGCQSTGKLYVSGGTYTGYCHGGFYCAHGADGEAFIKDATIRSGNYEGVFDYSELDGFIYSAMYVGETDTTVYIDGCTFDHAGKHIALVLRGSSGEQNITVNISNSTIGEDGRIRVDNETHTLNVGVGTDITADKIRDKDGTAQSTWITLTDKLYRKSTNKDFNVLSEYSDGQYIAKPATASVGQTIVVKAVDENGVPTEWETAEMVSGAAGVWEHVCDITTTEQIDAGIEITENSDGVPLSELKYNELWVMTKMVGVDTNTHGWWGCTCYPHWMGIGQDGTGLYANGASGGGTTGIRYASYYHFIRGNKMYWTDGSAKDVFCIVAGESQGWLNNYLDHYQCDYFEKVVITADSTRIIGVDTEIRILGRRT